MMDIIIFEGRTFEIDSIGFPVKTETGVQCGGCKSRHENAKAIKWCYRNAARLNEEIEDELRAERRVEEFFENRGYEEARAQEAYDARFMI